MPCHEPLIVNPVLKSGYPHSNGTITVDKDKVSNPSPPNRPNRQVKKSYTTGDPFWFHKAYYESKTKQHHQPQSTSNNIVNNNDRFYYVYENGYIKKKWEIVPNI
ncbi:hypothetical protein BLOT_008061 [Blomia tropicalis]|nr:hypothetical protein BLOT_008061 [Blomia tropicalis]